MTAAHALQTAIFALRYTANPTQADQILSVAAARGVDPGDLAELRAEWDALFAATVVRFGGCGVTAPSPLRCLCSHSQWRHLADALVCRSRACGCTEYRPNRERTRA